MANTAIGAGDITILQGNSSTQDMRINITPLTILQSGAITAIPALDPYVQVTWDGSSTGLSAGQYIRISNGTTIRTHGVLRLNPSGSTLFINEVPLGSPGYTVNIESAIQVGDTVTVYSHRPLWGLHSRISNRIFYQTWDVAYTDQNENVPPVANTGQWQSAKISSGSAAFRLPRRGANTSFAMSGTLSTYLWTLPSGVTLKSGYATSDDIIEVDAVAGYHLIALTVTDSNAKTHTAYTWLFVSDGTTGQTLGERYATSDLTVNQNERGLTGSLTIYGTNLEDILYPGAGLLINETPHFALGTLTDGVFVDAFCAYISGVSYTYNAERIASANITFESPIIYADKIVQPEQSLTEVANPANWTQCTSALSNPRGAFYFAWKHKTPALGDMHDIDANSLTTPRRKSIDYGTKTLGQAINLVSALFLVSIASAADGTTVIREKPLYMDNTDRNALATRMTWQAKDFSLSGQLAYQYNMLSRVAETIGGAFAYDGAVTKAWLAGKKWNQGSSSINMPSTTVSMSDGLNRVLEIVGHYHAEQNREINEIPLTLLGNMDVIDPAYMIWDRLTIDASLDPRGKGWSNNRVLATRVNRSWSKEATGYVKSITVGFTPETFGQPAKEIPYGNVRSAATNRRPVPHTPRVNETFGSVGIMLALNDTGKLARTYNYLASSPQWQDLNVSGSVCDFDWDYNSSFFTSGYVITEPLGVYLCAIAGLEIRVYHVADIKDPSSQPVEIASATMADGTMVYNARIRCSETTPTLVVVAWKDRTGVEFIRSTDGGSTWSSKANVGDAITDSASNDDAHIGLDIYGVTQVITAPDTTPEYGLYIATTAGGSFSAVTGTLRDATPNPLIKLLSGTVAYVTLLSSGFSVTFDAGGYSLYTVSTNISGFTAGVNAVGNPGNAAQGTGTWSIENSEGIKVDIDLGSSQSISNVLSDIFVNKPDDVAVISYHVQIYDTTVLQDEFESRTYQDGFDFTLGVWQSHNLSTDNSDTPRDAISLPVTGDQVVIWIHIRSSGSDWDVRLDNIQVVTGAGSSDTLQKVTSLTGTSNWTDVSPTTDVAPVRPHDLSIDIIDNNVLHTVADDDKWYKSTNAASAWSTIESATNKRTPYSVGDAIVFGGVGEIVLTLDGTNFEDKTGNLSAAMGTIGTIKKVLAL